MPDAEMYKAICLQVAQGLAEERIRQDVSMNRLAEMTGLSLTMVSYVERGMRSPTLDTFLRIAVALKVDLGVLINKAQASVRKA